MGMLALISFIVSLIDNVTIEILSKQKISMHFNIGHIVLILIVYAIANIFEYGYSIQQESNAIMYDVNQ